MKRWLVEAIQVSLRWLDDWPVGLKLNTPLSAILCNTFSQMADIWDCKFNPRPHGPVNANYLGYHSHMDKFLIARSPSHLAPLPRKLLRRQYVPLRHA